MGYLKQTGRHPLSVSVTSVDLEKLSQKTIFFGHQSVGINILDGISDIQRNCSVNLDIVESAEIGSKNRFYHAQVGKNGDPVSKIQDFSRILDNGIGEQADISFLKLCYVDFYYNTEVEAIFQHYKKFMERLSNDYPDVRFVHMTTPLLVREKGVKTFIKGIIGRQRQGYESNLRSEKFNRMIRDEYGGSGLLFDLARLESTLPDGSRLEYMLDEQKYYALVPEYTSDGGHLNETGRRIVASNLLKFLSNIE